MHKTSIVYLVKAHDVFLVALQAPHGEASIDTAYWTMIEVVNRLLRYWQHRSGRGDMYQIQAHKTPTPPDSAVSLWHIVQISDAMRHDGGSGDAT